MNLTLVIFLFIVGIVFIIKGGDLFVDASSWIAEMSGIPRLIIGATIVSLATTLPEILVSVMAAMKGKVDMSIGNAVGSVTANIGLIMAVSLICIPFVIERKDYLVKSILMMSASVLILIAGFLGQVGNILFVVLFIIFAIFFWEHVSSAKRSLKKKEKRGRDDSRQQITKKMIMINVAKFVIGAAGIVCGADLLVDNGSELARFAGISERIIGVTIVAIGTSLPELITTLTAIVKKQSALSVGNIIGANIIDLTLILPLCSLFSGKPLPITAAFAHFDLPACLIVGCIALIPAMIWEKFKREQGIIMLFAYIFYMVLTCSMGSI